jgi:hypothetical protein
MVFVHVTYLIAGILIVLLTLDQLATVHAQVGGHKGKPKGKPSVHDLSTATRTKNESQEDMHDTFKVNSADSESSSDEATLHHEALRHHRRRLGLSFLRGKGKGKGKGKIG